MVAVGAVGAVGAAAVAGFAVLCFPLVLEAIAPTGTTKAHRRYRDHLWTFAVYRSPVDV